MQSADGIGEDECSKDVKKGACSDTRTKAERNISFGCFLKTSMMDIEDGVKVADISGAKRTYLK
jgi:hypothetical protein